MKKNAGFTLIELLVTFLVLAILSAGTVTVVLSRPGVRCREAAEQISSALSETKSQALAKNGAWMELSYDSAKDVYVLKRSFAGELELDGATDISYTVSNSPTPVSVRSGDPLIISYDRGSGALTGWINSYSFSSEPVAGGKQINTYTLDIDNSKYCKQIEISKGKYKYTIEFERVTGKHTVNK